jgi:hypothetical protein
MVNTVGALHDVHSRRRLEEEARHQERQDQRKLDEFQARKLIEELKAAVDAFNKATPLGQVRVGERGTGRCDFHLPYGDSLSLEFFEVEPAMKLKRGIVRFAALVRGQDGAGLNFLLCRSDDADLYGRWVPLSGTVSAIMDPRRVPPRPEPFGFDRDGMRDVMLADRAVHIYILHWPEGAPGDAFLQAAHQAMQRQEQTTQRRKR